MKKILTVGALLLVVGVLSVTIISEKVLGGVNNVILQDSLNNYVGTEDSMLGPASAAYYTYTNLNLADPGGRNAVIKFNLSSLPADAQVSSAELSLYYYNFTSATTVQKFDFSTPSAVIITISIPIIFVVISKAFF